MLDQESPLGSSDSRAYHRQSVVMLISGATRKNRRIYSSHDGEAHPQHPAEEV